MLPASPPRHHTLHFDHYGGDSPVELLGSSLGESLILLAAPASRQNVRAGRFGIENALPPLAEPKPKRVRLAPVGGVVVPLRPRRPALAER